MSRGKSFTRQQQKKAAASKKGLANFVGADSLAAKIGKSPHIVDEYRKIYNKLCPECRALVASTGGQASYNDYCAKCQHEAQPHIQNVQAMLGRTKK